MPIALDPNTTVDVWLESDEATPPDKRPVFVCRYLSCRQFIKRAELLKQLDQAKGDNEAVNTWLNEVLKFNIVGTRNMVRDGAELDLATVLDDVLTAEEKWALADRVADATTLSPKKKQPSASSPESTPASCAKSAEAAPA